MNEPANFGTNEERPFNWPPEEKPYWSLKCTGNKYENPPYKTMATYIHDNPGRKATLPDKTVCMSLRQGESGQYRHYDVHNLYGWSQSPPTLQGAMKATGERSVVITRSTFPGSGRYAGHWLGDNDSTWEQLRASVIGIMEFNLFGIPYIGADICGFRFRTTKELCTRWMQLGAFYTFSRNHNSEDSPPQDPASFDEDVQEASRFALRYRYALLPYLYTLFFNAHVYGSTVIRPVHHEFPTDPNALAIDYQFMWGSALLFAPIVFEGKVVSAEGGENITLPVEPNSHIPLFLRGGSILVTQDPANNTYYSRQNTLNIYVALGSPGEDGESASGELFWDDGVSIDTIENDKYYLSKFYSSHKRLEMFVQQGPQYVKGLLINRITILGINQTVQRVTITVTGQAPRDLQFQFDTDQVLNINVSVKLDTDFRIEWELVQQLGNRNRRQATINDAMKIDCIPDYAKHTDHLEEECARRQCVWKTSPDYNIPACYIDKNGNISVIFPELATRPMFPKSETLLYFLFWKHLLCIQNSAIKMEKKERDYRDSCD